MKLLVDCLEGLDTARYQIIGSVPHGRTWIIAQRARDPEKPHFCVQYAGGGRYFSTLDELNSYTQSRWGLTFNDTLPR